MQRRDNQVARERGAHHDVRSLIIAHFADDEHLRVLPEQVSRCFREGQPARLAHFRLHNAGHDLLDGVFNGDDVPPAQRRESAQTGVNRRRLPAARRAGEQEQSGAPAQKRFEFGDGGSGKFQFINRRRFRVGKKTQHDFLTRHGRIRRHPYVAGRANLGLVDAPVLRQRLLIRL